MGVFPKAITLFPSLYLYVFLLFFFYLSWTFSIFFLNNVNQLPDRFPFSSACLIVKVMSTSPDAAQNRPTPLQRLTSILGLLFFWVVRFFLISFPLCFSTVYLSFFPPPLFFCFAGSALTASEWNARVFFPVLPIFAPSPRPPKVFFIPLDVEDNQPGDCSRAGPL